MKWEGTTQKLRGQSSSGDDGDAPKQEIWMTDTDEKVIIKIGITKED